MNKAYTDIEQSRKLAEILPIESADMGWNVFVDNSVRCLPINDWDLNKDGSYGAKFIPAWSLAALLEILPEEITDDNGYKTYIDIRKYDSKYQIAYYTSLNWSDTIATDEYENLVDAVVEMVVCLKENKKL